MNSNNIKSFKYVLVKQDYPSDEVKIIGLYPTNESAVNQANSMIDSWFEEKGQNYAESTLLREDQYFKNTSSFSVFFSSQSDQLIAEPLKWNMLTIKGQNGQAFIDNLKSDRAKEQQKKADLKKSNNALAKSTLQKLPLPQVDCNSPYCWCVIDLSKYLLDLQQDVEELEEAGDEYSFYTQTILRDDQFDALDQVSKMQGELAVLIGKTRFLTDKFNEFGKGAGQKADYPFYQGNQLYAITDKGITELAKESKKLNITDLADWCGNLEKGKLPKQLANHEASATLYNAVPILPVLKDMKHPDKPLPLFNSLQNINRMNCDVEIFLDYFAK